MGLLDGILSSVLGNLGNAGGGGLGGALGGALGGVLGGGNRNPRADSGSSMGSSSGSPLGGAAGSMIATALVAMAVRMLQQNGGISGLLERLRGAGLGQHAASWVSTGENMPIGPDALQQVFGSGELAQLAAQLGLTQEQASQGLAQVLPEVVNQMTPSGHVPQDDQSVISDLLAQLERRQA